MIPRKALSVMGFVSVSKDHLLTQQSPLQPCSVSVKDKAAEMIS